LRANQTTSFFFVSGFGSGAYSAKLLNGTKHRLSGFSQPRHPRTGAALPGLGDALNAGYLYLEVKCLGCGTHQPVALN
jgi:hypothetical protein